MKSSLKSVILSISIVLTALSSHASDDYEKLKELVSQEVCDFEKPANIGELNKQIANIYLDAKIYNTLDKETFGTLERIRDLVGSMTALAVDRSEKNQESNAVIHEASRKFVCSLFAITKLVTNAETAQK